MNPTLAARRCIAVWACAVCPREATQTYVVEPDWLLVLCAGCSRGFSRLLARGVGRAEMAGAL